MKNTRRNEMLILLLFQTEELFSCMITAIPDLLLMDFVLLTEVVVEAGLELAVLMHHLTKCSNLSSLPMPRGLMICMR
jgi:hypothetical protein